MVNNQLSPAVTAFEDDQTGVPTAVSTIGCAYAGVFTKGPIEQFVTVTSVSELEQVFGKPNAKNRTDFLLCSQFLRRSQNLKVLRINQSSLANATSDGNGISVIKNKNDYDQNYVNGEGSFGSWVCKTAGNWGNSLKVSVCPADSTAFTGWNYASLFAGQPTTSPYVSARSGSLDELHIVVIDEDGGITGTPNTVLEKYAFVSQASDAKNADETETNYYKTIINQRSRYIYWGDHPTALTDAGSVAASTSFTVTTTSIDSSLSGGISVDTGTIAEYLTGFQLFSNTEEVNFDIMFTPALPNGTDGTTLANNLIAIAEQRKDFTLCISPPIEDTVGTTTPRTDVIEFANSLTSSSYAVCDTTAVKVFDRYNDDGSQSGGSYVWIPASANYAANIAFSTQESDIAYAPAGSRRGIFLGVTEIAYNPSITDRDVLFPARLNPVVFKGGKGIYSLGDRTLINRDSVFDQVAVRRVFIYLRKSISQYAEDYLFEKNNDASRIVFKAGLRPFLDANVKDEIIEGYTLDLPISSDPNEFIVNIRIAPINSIRFITLNFVAVRNTRSLVFTESVGG